MKNLTKLSRAEMKNVLGGVNTPPSCKNSTTRCSAVLTTEHGAVVIDGYCSPTGPTCYCVDAQGQRAICDDCVLGGI